MHRLFVITLILVFLGALSLFVERTKPSSETEEMTVFVVTSSSSSNKSSTNNRTSYPIGAPPPELCTYASPENSIQDDLRLLYDYLSSSLLPTSEPGHVLQSKDLTDFLHRRDPHQHAALIGTQLVPQLIDDNQKLIDRWGSPLLIHTSKRLHFEIRSAGPDQIPHTQDDTVWPPTPKRTRSGPPHTPKAMPPDPSTPGP